MYCGMFKFNHLLIEYFTAGPAAMKSQENSGFQISRDIFILTCQKFIKVPSALWHYCFWVCDFNLWASTRPRMDMYDIWHVASRF